MEQQIQELSAKVDELTELIQENQKMVKSLYKRAQLASYFVAIKWIAIIGLTIGSLYYIQPYLETTLNFYQSVAGESAGKDAGAVGQIKDAKGILDMLKTF